RTLASKTGRSTGVASIESGGPNALVLSDEDIPHLAAEAIPSPGYCFSDLKEVIIPAWTIASYITYGCMLRNTSHWYSLSSLSVHTCNGSLCARGVASGQPCPSCFEKPCPRTGGLALRKSGCHSGDIRGTSRGARKSMSKQPYEPLYCA